MMMVAQECGLTPRYFIHTLGDAHLYSNHIDKVKKQLLREPLPLPRVEIADKPFDELTFDDITLHDYQHHKFIRFKVAV